MGKVIFISCTNVARYMIEEIYNNDSINKTDVVGIVNLNEKQAVNKANFDSYFDLSIKYNIPIHYCDNVNDEVTLNWIREKDADIIIQSGWSQKFGDELLNLPKYGCIGEHPAPLPRGRGAACVNWAVLTGEREWGDTFFEMVEEYDKGIIYAQEFFNIETYDNVYTVYEKVAAASQRAIIKNIDKWSNGIFDKIEQDDSKATYYKRRRPTDGLFTFDMDASTLHDFIRAQTKPYPGAYFMIGERKITVLQTEYTNSTANNHNPGDIIEICNDGGALVCCRNQTVIKLMRVQEESKPSIWMSDWAKNNKIN